MPSVIKSSSKTVTTAGTAERLTAAALWVTGLTLTAKTGNVGNIFLGDSDVDNTAAPLIPGDEISTQSPVIGGVSVPFDLYEIFIDSAQNGEGVNFWYQRG